MPPNITLRVTGFDGKTTQFLAGIKTNRTIQALVIPLGIWFALPMNSFIGASTPDLIVNLH